VVADLYPLIEKKSQILTFESQPLMMTGHVFAIKTLIHNLITNASKYTPERGNILIQVKNQEDAILLKVSDSGIGILAENYGYVFNRFYRETQAKQNQTNGCGLGLAIVERIVRLHQAKISLGTPKWKKGLEVNIYFPKAKDYP